MLARAGLLRGSFIPPEPLRNLRQVSRHHQRVTAMLAAEKNRLVRVLGDAGIRLTAVVSDPHGVAARAMIDCLLDGGTPQQALAHAGRLRAPREELAAALEGEPSEEHLFVARMIRRHIDALLDQATEKIRPAAANRLIALVEPRFSTVATAAARYYCPQAPGHPHGFHGNLRPYFVVRPLFPLWFGAVPEP